MSNKSYKLIIILIGIALLFIIAMQALWLNNFMELKAEELNSKTNEALSAVINQLQRNEDVMQLKTNLNDLLPNQINRENNYHYNSKNIIERKRPETIIKKITAHSYSNSLSLHDSISTFKNTNTIIKILPNGKSIVSISTDSDKEGKMENKLSHLDTILKKIIIESSTKRKPILDRIIFNDLYKIIKNKLTQKGLELNFEYAVVRKEKENVTLKQSINYNPASLSKQYTARLFEEDINPENNYLVLYFPNENQYTFSKMKNMLYLSILFTLIIIATFLLTAKMIFKQKKLGEIKNDFINNMTHEFKTPLATISIAIDSIGNSQVRHNDERFNYYTSIIKEENNKLNEHIEKVLQMAAMDKEKIQFHFSKIHIEKLIDTSISSHQLLIQNKHAEVTTDFNCATCLVNGDEFHLINVFNNLIDNALKYSTEYPKINIQTYHEKSQLYIVIKDNGIGMTKETLNHLFEKFYRAQKGNIHDVKGFGLGLSYVKSILLAHDGEITVESQLGVGSVFKLKLPTYEISMFTEKQT